MAPPPPPPSMLSISMVVIVEMSCVGSRAVQYRNKGANGYVLFYVAKRLIEHRRNEYSVEKG